ncbi:MAG: outer membrane protein assembly factor BamC [Methylococcales bacterium]
MKLSFQVGFIVCVVIGTSGCSTLQSWFPDKEKDYQFTTELPPLVIPTDLVQKISVPAKKITPTAANSVEAITPKKLAAKKIESVIEKIAAVENRPTLTDAETELNRNEIQVSLTHENAPTLNLNVPLVRAWRIVGKALSRSGIEVTNRGQDSGQIYIQFVEAKQQPEKSLWDNTISVFNPFSENEQSYILQFHEANLKTSVTVLTPELQTINDGLDNKILLILFDAIKTDLSK